MGAEEPGRAVEILLVEDNPGDTRLVREMLAEAQGASFDFELECADRLSYYYPCLQS